jgi:phosphopentomutase
VPRATILVLDSLGVGCLPDAADWGDKGADTLGHILDTVGSLHLPNLRALGLGNIKPQLGPVDTPSAAWGRAMTASRGKDTISGHWEIAGVPVEERFLEVPHFDAAIMDAFEAFVGKKALGNKAASGTVIIDELGPEHMATGRPIVYTSADSVFQIAAHEDVVPLHTLYAWCDEAFRIVSPRGIARVIARPFIGQPGSFVRTGNRRDTACLPPKQTVVDILHAAGHDTVSVGKIKSIFGDRGFSHALKAPHNPEIMDATLKALDAHDSGLIFVNFVDFDMLFGHRRDPRGYADALVELDRRLPEVMQRMGDDDLLVFTADHGCDPTWEGSDHTREYTPVLAWRKGGLARPLGTRTTMADIGATVADHLGVAAPPTGESFLEAV